MCCFQGQYLCRELHHFVSQGQRGFGHKTQSHLCLHLSISLSKYFHDFSLVFSLLLLLQELLREITRRPSICLCGSLLCQSTILRASSTVTPKFLSLLEVYCASNLCYNLLFLAHLCSFPFLLFPSISLLLPLY